MKKMTKKERVKIAIEHTVKMGYKVSIKTIEAWYQDRRYFPPRQSVSKSTIYRAVNELEQEGLITSYWICRYPIFRLVWKLK